MPSAKLSPKTDDFGPLRTRSRSFSTLQGVLKAFMALSPRIAKDGGVLVVALALWVHPLGTAARADDKVEGKVLTVSVEGVEGKVKQNVEAFLAISPFAGKPAPSEPRLRWLYRAGEQEIGKALQPFGYFKPHIESSLTESATGWVARYRIDAGPPIPFGDVDIKVLGPAARDPAFQKLVKKAPLAPGKPMDQKAYEDLVTAFELAASQRGYFDAKWKQHRIEVDLRTYRADVTLHFDAGERYRFGAVQIQQDVLSPDFLRRFIDIQPGQPYDATALQALQRDLTASEYFSRVEVDALPEKAQDREVPVEVVLEPSKRRKYTMSLGYGTDTGVRGRLGVTGRRANQFGHKYNAEILASQIKYGVAAGYTIPGPDPRTSSYGLIGSYQNEDSSNRQFESLSLGGNYKYQDGLWVKTYSLDYLLENFTISGEDRTSKLLIPSLDWSRVQPQDLQDRIYAKNGSWVHLNLRGSYAVAISDVSFVQPTVEGKWIKSVWNNGRVIARGALGTTIVSDFDQLPSSLRYYAGGDRSVRGYKLNSIGPRDSDNDVVGGKHQVIASLEYEHRIVDKWSAAVFVDAGDAFNNGSPDLKTGVGMGIRWQSPVGPIRVDLASGLDRPPGDKLRLHISIGPDL